MKRRSFLKLTATTVAASPIALNADTVASTVKSPKDQIRIDSPEVKNANHIYLRALSASKGFNSRNNVERDNMIKLLIAYPLRFRETRKPLLNEEQKELSSWKAQEAILGNIVARYNKRTRYVEIFLPNETEEFDISKNVLSTVYLATVLKALNFNDRKVFEGIIYEQSQHISTFIEGLEDKYSKLIAKNIEEHKEKAMNSSKHPSFIEYVEYYRAKAITDSRAVVSTKDMTKEQKLMLTSTYEELTTFEDGKYIADMLNLNNQDNVFSALVMQKTYQTYLDFYHNNAEVSNAFNLILQTGLGVELTNKFNIDSETGNEIALPINLVSEEDKLAFNEFKLERIEVHFENILPFIH